MALDKAKSQQLIANSYFSPTRLDDARNLPLERQLAEADAAQLELAQVAARSPAARAARVGARGELRPPLRLRDH